MIVQRVVVGAVWALYGSVGVVECHVHGSSKQVGGDLLSLLQENRERKVHTHVAVHKNQISTQRIGGMYHHIETQNIS